MTKLYSIGEAAKKIGVSISTLRRWEKLGRLVPEKMPSKHRRYREDQLLDSSALPPRMRREGKEKRKTIAYARVSSSDQKADLERQKEALGLYCAANGWEYEILSDLGSGMNDRKKGLKTLLNEIISGKVGRLVIMHKDQLLRFGAELVFSLCEIKNTEVVIVNQGEEVKFEEELAKDVLEIITVFSARLYGARSRKNQQLIDGMKKAVEAVQDERKTKR